MIVINFIGSEWSFASEHHVFDAGIAVFTLLLASFTGFLWKATAGLLRHTPQIERAYISGGGVPVMETEYIASAQAFTPISKPTGQFEVHINNHGKTPGELTEIGMGFCEAMAVP
jgi:hypothetical protein